MFVILFLSGRLAVSGGHLQLLILSLHDVCERKGLNKWLSSFRRKIKERGVLTQPPSLDRQGRRGGAQRVNGGVITLAVKIHEV